MNRKKDPRASFAVRAAEAGLWFGAAVCAVSIGVTAVEAHSVQRQAMRVAANPAEPAAADMLDRPAKAGDVLGRLEIPKLGFSVAVLESYDPATLRRGVGHVPGTAVPGGLGNLVLAGHRDTFFRPLRNVKAGMEVEITSASGTSRYVIDSTEVVAPEEVRVLDTGEQPTMTLITCYPFEFVGSAPRRFVVHAHLVSDPA